MHWFYCSDIIQPETILGPEESRHCASVLRLRIGDLVHLVDGKGGYYEASVVRADPRATKVLILKTTSNYRKRNYRVHIAIAPPKSPDRFEWFVEKAAEIGIDEITPLVCHRSERNRLKVERLEKILISSIKQSKQAWLPSIHPVREYTAFLESIMTDKAFIACQEARACLSEVYQKGEDAIILVGPEGDFTEEERSIAINRGIRPVNMGNTVLRTETAGLVACHTIALLNAPIQ